MPTSCSPDLGQGLSPLPSLVRSPRASEVSLSAADPHLDAGTRLASLGSTAIHQVKYRKPTDRQTKQPCILENQARSEFVLCPLLYCAS